MESREQEADRRDELNLADRTEVSVWCVALRGAATAERALLELLDPGETARAARLASDDRRRYVISHGVLRLILAAFTGGEPRALRFATGYRGKPYLPGPRAPDFSLSHSGDTALIAVTWDGPVGVDVERVRPDLEIAAFARDLVGAGEVARIAALPHERRGRAWFQAWTRLEAVAKASGAGLGEDATEGPPAEPFYSRDVDVDDAHVGAVAVRSTTCSIIYETLAGFAA